MAASSLESPGARRHLGPIDPCDGKSARHRAELGIEDSREEVGAAQVPAVPFVAGARQPAPARPPGRRSQRPKTAPLPPPRPAFVRHLHSRQRPCPPPPVPPPG